MVYGGIARCVKAGASHFALVFGAGFLLAFIRIPILEPRPGTRSAELAEAPVMAVAVVQAARFIVSRFAIAPEAGPPLLTGLVALALLLAVEFGGVLALRGMTIETYFATRDPVSGTVNYPLPVAFALLPWGLAKRDAQWVRRSARARAAGGNTGPCSGWYNEPHIAFRRACHRRRLGVTSARMSTAHSPGRRLDLDWIRIVAFLLLIAYHVGMYYVSWDWHVKSPAASPAIEPLMLLVNPWRLGVLFLVSGAATAFMLAKLAPGPLARLRSWRLLVPLAFAMVVIVVPQSYFEVVEKGGYTGSFWEFWGRYLRADRTFCRGSDCLIVPTWNHMWFVAYLWCYTMVLAAVLALVPSWRERAEHRLERALAGWRLLVLPAVVLAVIRIALVGRFGSTHALVDDWYNHAQYFAVFAFGFLAARSPAIWEGMERLRWSALALALASWAFLVWYFLLRDNLNNPPEALRLFQRVVYALDQWAAMVAACGFARRLVKADSPARRYLTDAIFPFYIVHQTAIIAFAVWLRPLALPPAAEGFVLLAATAVACVATYEIVKRVRWLRPLFGLKPAAP